MNNLLTFTTFLLAASTISFSQHVATKASVKPQIDGTLEEVWLSGRIESAFVQIEPELFGKPTVDTEFYVLYDEESIYLAARLYQPRSTVKSNQARRDAEIVSDGDYVVFSLDPLNSGNSAYFFIVNAVNAIADGVLDREGNWDRARDVIFVSAAGITDDFWSVEMEIPLTSLSFQEQSPQAWGFMITRSYAQRREKIINHLVDKNQPYRIQDFDRLINLEGLRKKTKFVVNPYAYFSHESDRLRRSYQLLPKFGAELRYNPIPSMTILATVRPDYAQLETDKEIINVTDLPTEYPEKRPFFTESSDLYPGLAVNTRNIADINGGVKLRYVGSNVKFDVTGVLDRDDTKWYLGDVRWTDNETYHLEVISGARHQGRADYNVTTNLRTWFFDKRLTAYTWFGTINGTRRQRNEYESVNSMKWISRNFNAGIWNHLKTKFYNPNIVGFNTLSNETIVESWAEPSFISESGFVRRISPGVKVSYRDLFTEPGHASLFVDLYLRSMVWMSKNFGNWEIGAAVRPRRTQKFRLRQVDGYPEERIHEDAVSRFVLIDQSIPSIAFSFRTDYSRGLGISLVYDTHPVRQSKGSNLQSEMFWKLTSNWLLSYSLSYVRLHGSPYQTRYEQAIYRLKVEYNITDRINVRGIVQLSKTQVGSKAPKKNRSPHNQWNDIMGVCTGELSVCRLQQAERLGTIESATERYDHELSNCCTQDESYTTILTRWRFSR